MKHRRIPTGSRISPTAHPSYHNDALPREEKEYHPPLRHEHWYRGGWCLICGRLEGGRRHGD